MKQKIKVFMTIAFLLGISATSFAAFGSSKTTNSYETRRCKTDFRGYSTDTTTGSNG
ncbi:hypothetical protein [Fusobacterium sp.]|uniref:hypothetical protein n=1 Tax=Fusobacterium sp. TaxID=68766 RepID=UPI002900B451|nr:hypothetical protein [Fusobacterium sp.]MDU1912691.1 hypothetical protein [Fusobacterium sp.]